MKLQEWMEEKGLVDATAAALLGVERSTVYRWRLGQRTPSARVMGEIASMTLGAVMPNDWIEIGQPMNGA